MTNSDSNICSHTWQYFSFVHHKLLLETCLINHELFPSQQHVSSYEAKCDFQVNCNFRPHRNEELLIIDKLFNPLHRVKPPFTITSDERFPLSTGLERNESH